MKQSTLKRAMCVTGSWVRSWGLKTTVEKGRLVVAGKPVTFTKGTKGLLVDAERILSQDPQEVQSELEALAKKLHIKAPPMPRSVDKDFVCARDDYEGRTLRLTALARSADPDRETMEKYRGVIKREADRAFFRWGTRAKKLGFTVQDFFSIALTYAVVFFHRKADPLNENRTGANLTRYLQQEFTRWAKVTEKDMRNIIPSEAVEVSDIMGLPTEGAILAHNSVDGYYTLPEHRERWTDLLARRREARANLKAKLEALPHDRLVEALTAATVLDDESGALAGRMLKKHAQCCPTCRPTVG